MFYKILWRIEMISIYDISFTGQIERKSITTISYM